MALHPETGPVLSRIQQAGKAGRTELGLLLDPDRIPREELGPFLKQVPLPAIDYLLVGGSLLLEDRLDDYLMALSERTGLPVILFPGHAWHISTQADALLFLSLISGRNPDLLIGQQVQAAGRVAHSSLEVIPTGYVLIEGGRLTSVSYMSQTLPIPADKPEIALSTALAGQLLGMKLIYLEAGSGASYPVPESLVRSLRRELSVPLVVGGGIREPGQAAALAGAGAGLIVIGTAAERSPAGLNAIAEAISEANVRNNGRYSPGDPS